MKHGHHHLVFGDGTGDIHHLMSVSLATLPGKPVTAVAINNAWCLKIPIEERAMNHVFLFFVTTSFRRGSSSLSGIYALIMLSTWSGRFWSATKPRDACVAVLAFATQWSTRNRLLFQTLGDP
ncbi:hypothetical protein TNCT_532511 [Trichonephila clavata]|uniref:Uncharacterized protein n=1 Tax=Trichonephila clavata TaxID=2740835 RepID=A0A8X6GNR8_TRICU|nr:hypothetical protein TNCT_532511 [Trichonephila clavata]